MPCQELFYDHPACVSFTARVTACQKGKEGWWVALDATAFYPEGGGQPSDRGELSGRPVWDVQRREGEIWHYLPQECPVGSEVTGKIDAAFRRRCQQHHTGEHIFSGVLHRLYGAENVGFHMGQDGVTVDTSLPLTPEQIEEAERVANEAIFENRPVRAFVPPKEELLSLSYRSKKEILGPVRLVEIEGYDRCACCGTHVESAGEIGRIQVTDWMHYKAGMRLTLLCGQEALRYSRGQRQREKALMALLSAKAEDLVGRVQRLQEENGALAYAWEKERENRLEEKAAQFKGCNRPLCVQEALSAKEAQSYCLLLQKETSAPVLVLGEGGAFALYDEKNVTALFSALKQKAPVKGGGKPPLCQGKTDDADALMRAFWKEMEEWNKK